MTSSAGATRRWGPNLLLAVSVVLMGAGGLTAVDDVRLGIGVFLIGGMCLGISIAMTGTSSNGGEAA